ncbi:YciI family protein [Acetobacteraceae bacterium ESL0709]|nr:YciI family protein [Acetobacteraceae bacterium ESL0697]MDF7678861.1 YciI family protein [Acetobacteraceae bacterium ESL0709]
MSTLFIATITYLASAEDVAAQRPAHRAFLDGFYKEDLLLMSGPMTSGKGGVLLVRGNISQQELAQRLSHDPFVTSGVAHYEFCEFNAVKYAAFLEGHI